MEFIFSASESLTLAAWEPNWDTGILSIVSAALKLVALVGMAYILFRAIGMAMNGKASKGIVVFVSGLLVAAVMWEPTLINRLIDVFGSGAGTAVETVNDVVGGGGKK